MAPVRRASGAVGRIVPVSLRLLNETDGCCLATFTRRQVEQMTRFLPIAVLAAFLAACQTPIAAPEPAPAVAPEEAPRWLSVASDADFDRLNRLPEAWDEALAAARRAGFDRRIQVEGRLLDPEGALDWAAPTPGAYRCRLIRFAASAGRGRMLTAYPHHFCHVGADGDSLFLTKETGTERPFGYLWDDGDPRRMIFLGAILSGDEDNPPPYGADPATDIAGVFERVGSLRFRLVIPRFRDGLTLDIFEFTAAPVQPEE
jgi:hypothetical protein